MSLAKYDNKGSRQEDGSSRTTLVTPQISSPDPVEMVRQYEHDENIARILQAEFDSQMDTSAFSADISALSADISASGADISASPFSMGRIQIQAGNASASSRPPTPIFFQSRNVTIDLSTSGPSSTTVYYSAGDGDDVNLPGGLNETLLGDDDGSEEEDDDRELDDEDDEGDSDHEDEEDDELREDAEELEDGDIEDDDLEDEDDDLGDEDDDLEDEEVGDEDDEEGRSRLFPEDIDRLPTHLLATPRSSRGAVHECTVCLQGYDKGDELRVLPCFHQFHKSCIDPWLLSSTTCPTCRVKVDLSGQAGTS